MNWFDLALIGLLAVAVTSGIRKGISRSGLGLLAVVFAFLAASWLYPPYQVGFLIVFVGVICMVGAGACFLGKWLRKTDQGWLDKLLGGAAGLVNALLLCVIAAVALMAFAPKQQRAVVAASQLGPYALDAVQVAADFVPDEWRARIERNCEELGRALPRRYREEIPPFPRNEI